MSTREVIRTSGDWHVQSLSDLHLETQYASGNQGTVYVYGNLTVIGTSTSIQSNNLDIGDKILVLNKGEPGLNGGAQPGVSINGYSGLSVARGGPIPDSANANFMWDQNKEWTYDGTTNEGMWVASVGDVEGNAVSYAGLIVNAIRTGSPGTNLSLLGIENSGATVTLEGVVDYTQRIVTRANEDDVPNKGYVDWAIEHAPDRRRIQLNYRNNSDVFIEDDTNYVELISSAVPGYALGSITEPQMQTSIGGNQWITTYANRMTIGDIQVNDSNEITMKTINTNLVLSTKPGPVATQNPSVEVRTSLSLKMDLLYDEPESTAEAVKLYSKAEGQGGTGLYFINSENVRDELVSKRRSFFASLMF